MTWISALSRTSSMVAPVLPRFRERCADPVDEGPEVARVPAAARAARLDDEARRRLAGRGREAEDRHHRLLVDLGFLEVLEEPAEADARAFRSTLARCAART